MNKTEKKCKVLIVDDARFMRAMIARILKELNFSDFYYAENGEEGVEKYNKNKPDLVFMDITMPQMNGLDAAKIILESDPKAKIIICSAMGQKPNVLESLNMGVKGFVVKPFSKKEIEKIIEKTLK